MEKKLRSWLSSKLKEIYEATKSESGKFDKIVEQLKTGKINSYKSEYKPRYGWGYRDGWRISKNDSSYCTLSVKKGERKIIHITIHGVESNAWYGTPAMLYKCLEEFDSIEQQFIEFAKTLEEKQKIQERFNFRPRPSNILFCHKPFFQIWHRNRSHSAVRLRTQRRTRRNA